MRTIGCRYLIGTIKIEYQNEDYKKLPVSVIFEIGIEIAFEIVFSYDGTVQKSAIFYRHGQQYTYPRLFVHYNLSLVIDYRIITR